MNTNNYNYNYKHKHKHKHRRDIRDKRDIRNERKIRDENFYEHWIKRLEQEKELSSHPKSIRSIKIENLHKIFKKETKKEFIINWWSEDMYFLEIYDMDSSTIMWQSNLIQGIDNVMKKWINYLEDYINLPF